MICIAAYPNSSVVCELCRCLFSAFLISKHVHHSRAVMMYAYGNLQRSTVPNCLFCSVNCTHYWAMWGTEGHQPFWVPSVWAWVMGHYQPRAPQYWTEMLKTLHPAFQLSTIFFNLYLSFLTILSSTWIHIKYNFLFKESDFSLSS